MTIWLGDFESELTAAVAEDLLARLQNDPEVNFEDADFERLLPAFADAILAGLNPTLPGWIREDLVEVLQVASEENQAGWGRPLVARLLEDGSLEN